jgi:hypothetical protein
VSNAPFSYLDRRERFWANLAITIIITAVLVAAAIAWFLLREKVGRTENLSEQQTNPAAVPLQAGNLEPMAALNAGNGTSTNTPTPLPASFVSVTNSN